MLQSDCFGKFWKLIQLWFDLKLLPTRWEWDFIIVMWGNPREPEYLHVHFLLQWQIYKKTCVWTDQSKWPYSHHLPPIANNVGNHSQRRGIGKIQKSWDIIHHNLIKYVSNDITLNHHQFLFSTGTHMLENMLYYINIFYTCIIHK